MLKTLFTTTLAFVILPLLSSFEAPKLLLSPLVTGISPEWATLINFGHQNFISDLNWIKFLQDLDETSQEILEHTEHSHEYYLIKTATTYDPKFCYSYLTGGSILSIIKRDRLGALDILKDGIANCPQYEKKLYFYLGFHYMEELREPLLAADAFKHSMGAPDSPAYLPKLISRLYAEGGNLELSKSLLVSMKKGKPLNIQKEIDHRIQLIDLEIILENLNKLIQKYTDSQKTPLYSLSDLVKSGYLTHIPLDPTGGKLFLENNQVRSTTQKRYRVQRLDESH